uniref:Uncharacterized protein n=2 Tax=Entomoneis paludosa TaxID=265537 RepID=A0A7S2Y986_9STRA|mmetsp:Transcript_23427/g.48633  ORF Transcript_23427/g.48633 Transcript_23427/m.48633 type:complete len:342 (+) Transcript_23427:24-1049(+)
MCVLRPKLLIFCFYLFISCSFVLSLNSTQISAHDNPQKALGIEIYNATDFQRMRWHWNGCGLLLHELCHLIHQHVWGLPFGPIVDLYEQARASGKYHNILRRDWAGKELTEPSKTTATEDENLQESSSGERDLHYAMVNHKEFFAEMSVTYLAQGYPHLKDAPPSTNVVTCSPPLMEPTVLARLAQRHAMAHAWPPPSFLPADQSPRKTPQQPPDTLQQPLLPRAPMTARAPPPGSYYPPPQQYNIQQHPPFCNKFFPFTSGQLQRFDPRLYQAMHHYWTTDVALWKDPVMYPPSDHTDNESSSVASSETDQEDDDDDHCCFPQRGCRLWWQRWQKTNLVI